MEPHDYRIYYSVNINLRHQYGISVTERKIDQENRKIEQICI